MKRPHYKTLDVAPDAKPAAIKRAYRRKAAKAHPDKGGSHEAMAELAHAYEVLISPDRRLLYDATGQDKEVPVATRAQGLLLEAFHDALAKDAPNILLHVRKFIDSKRAESEKSIAVVTKGIAQFRKRRDRIKTKGVNVFHMIIDQQVAQGEGNLLLLKSSLEVCDEALASLDAYESDEAVPPSGSGVKVWI